MKKKVQTVPKILEQRLLIDKTDRQILQAIERLSPFDTGNLYVTGNDMDKDIPSVEMIADEVKMKPNTLMKHLSHIRDVWEVSNNLPTGNGKYTADEALVHTLLNQHKLRFDPQIDDYRVPQIHFYTSELGLGNLYVNEKAFEGERIFRKAMGFDEIMNSYHIQGGIMPEVIAMFGKQKNMRALMTGLNKTGVDADPGEIENIRMIVEAVQKKPATDKQMKHIIESFVNTVDSMEEAARSVAYELSPLLQEIPNHVPIHLYYSYNDDANLSEIEDQLITVMRKTYKKIEEANVKLPSLRSDFMDMKYDAGQHEINVRLADYVTQKLVKDGNQRSKGKPVKDAIRTYFYDDKGRETAGLEALVKVLKKDYYKNIKRNKAAFEDAFDIAKGRYFKSDAMTYEKTLGYREFELERKSAIRKKMIKLEDNISEHEQFENAQLTEEREKHSWFTKKIAIKPTESKVNEMLKKSIYKSLYEDILIPELKGIIGRDLKINLHTDREITVFVPDPAILLGMNSFPDDQLYGTLISSIPRTNRQRSNEPLLESTFELQKGHESAVSTRLKLQKERPKTIDQFNKRSFAFSDVMWTSYGSDGFRLQPKFVIAPTRIEGEYIENPETVFYLKTPTRHDTVKMGELLKKGNKGTWAGKRIDKGGPTTGSVIQIRHPDRSDEWMFMDDNFYESIADKYSENVQALEGKISRARKTSTKRNYKNQLDVLLEEAKPNMGYMVLANDLHLGAFSFPGRPSSNDVIRASQTVAVQSLGLDKIVMLTGTEFLHGNMKIPSWGYYSSDEGQLVDPITFKRQSRALIDGLRKQGYSDDVVLKHYEQFIFEQMDARAVFLAKDQKEMFRYLLKPFFTELMDNDIPVYVGSGNHWNQSQSEDEANVIASMFDEKYHAKGLMGFRHASGQAFTIEPIKLPSSPDTYINAIFAHKMQPGKTEISRMLAQAMGTKEDALYVIAADRHQSGMIAEKERYGILDTGKQTTMPYVTQIGKASSTRGTIAMGYSLDRELVYSGRFWMDDVNIPIIGWDKRSKMLKDSSDIIKEEIKAQYD